MARRSSSCLRDGAPDKAETVHRAQELMAAARAPATERSYAQAIRHFQAHGGSIPASASVVMAYLAEHAGKLAVATLAHRVIAIHRAHIDAGHKSPAMDPKVKQTMRGIRRTYGTAQRRVQALVKDDLLEMLALAEKQAPLKAARDTALLLVGFAGAFRRSELVGLRYEDMTEFPDGLELLLRRSKTDQDGQGRTVFIPCARGARCPVKALKHWLNLLSAGQQTHLRVISGLRFEVPRTCLRGRRAARALCAAGR